MSNINEFEELSTMIQMIAKMSMKYSVPRYGQVKKVVDSEASGKILVIIPSLGWTSEDQGVWCYPCGTSCLITPKIDDWVIVEWIDGNRDQPALYTSIAYWMKGMLPDNYDGSEKTQVLFENNDRDFSITYDGNNNKYSVKNNKGSELTFNFKTKTLEIKGEFINLLGATESFILGDTLCSAFTILCSSIALATSGDEGSNASGINTIKSAFSIFSGKIENFKSTKIKGE